MTNQILLGLFDLGIAIALYISVGRARKDKQLKITLISGPMTTVRSIVLSGKGLTIAIIGWGVSAILLTFSGLSSLLLTQTWKYTFFITFISIFLVIITMIIASYFTSNPEEQENKKQS